MAEYDNPRPSSQPIGSTDLAVAKDNLITVDKFVNDTADTYTNRKGVTKETLAGISKASSDAFDAQLSQQQTDFDAQTSENQNTFDNQTIDNQNTFDAQLSQQQTDFDNQQASAIAAAGYEVIGNFTDGVTATKLSDAVYYAGDPLDNFANEGFYAWNLTFPKTVAPGSTPFDEAGWQLAATGYTKQSGAIQLFGQSIDANISIPAGQNALSINPTVADGVTVTVPVGSGYVILGSTN